MIKSSATVVREYHSERNSASRGQNYLEVWLLDVGTWDFLVRFHFIRRFWNQILTYTENDLIITNLKPKCLNIQNKSSANLKQHWTFNLQLNR